ncbi:hypothetical protein VT98_13053, partial [Candidatus Electrothrix communis]
MLTDLWELIVKEELWEWIFSGIGIFLFSKIIQLFNCKKNTQEDIYVCPPNLHNQMLER